MTAFPLAREQGPQGSRGSISLLGWHLCTVPTYRVVLTMLILWPLWLHPRHPLGLNRREKALERAGMLFSWRGWDGAEGSWTE